MNIKVTPLKTGLTLFFLAIVLFGYYKLNYIMGEFSETFNNFEVDLPIFTKVFSNYHLAIFSFLAIISVTAATLVFGSNWTEKCRKWGYFYTLCSPLICMVFVLFVCIAAYLPII